MKIIFLNKFWGICSLASSQTYRAKLASKHTIQFNSIQMSFIDSKTLQLYDQNYATKLSSKATHTKLKNRCCPQPYPDPRRPDIAEKHRTSGTWTPRPQNHNPPTFKVPGDRRKRAHLPGDLQSPKAKKWNSSHRRTLTGKTSKLELFSIKLLLKKKTTYCISRMNQIELIQWSHTGKNYSILIGWETVNLT